MMRSSSCEQFNVITLKKTRSLAKDLIGLRTYTDENEAAHVDFRQTSKTGVRSSGFFTPVTTMAATKLPITTTFKYQTSTSKGTGEFPARASLDVKRR